MRGNGIVIIAQLRSYFEVQSRNSCYLVAPKPGCDFAGHDYFSHLIVQQTPEIQISNFGIQNGKYYCLPVSDLYPVNRNSH